MEDINFQKFLEYIDYNLVHAKRFFKSEYAVFLVRFKNVTSPLLLKG